MLKRTSLILLACLLLSGVASAQTGIDVSDIYAPANLTVSPLGDIVFAPAGKDVYPSQNYSVNLGLLTNKWLALHAAELWAETLVAQSTMATIGGRILVGPTTSLTADLAVDATSITVKHNNLANGDRVYLEADGKIEFMAITSAASGTGPYTYSVTRSLDGSGADAWYAGDAVFSTGQMTGGYLQTIQADSPAGYWRLGEAAGPTAADSVGSNTGTYSATGLAYGQTGLFGTTQNTAVAFDGVAGSISVPDAAALDLADTFTLELWLKRSVTGTVQALLSKGTNGYSVFLRADNKVYLSKRGVADIAHSSAAITDANWHHIVVTKAGATVHLYIDGAEGTVADTASTCADTAVALSIGSAEGTGYFFSGYLDEVAVYPTALSAARVAAHYAARLLTPDGVGTGFIDLYSVRGVKSATEYGPTIVGNVRNSALWYDWLPRWAIGNLNGLYNYSDSTYGAAFGDQFKTWMAIDATNGVRGMSGTNPRFQIRPDGSGVLGNGNIYWDTAGNLFASGWAVNAAALTKDTGTDATSSGMAPADYPFYAGSTYANRATAPFRVTPAGKVYATNAEIAGKVTAGDSLFDSSGAHFSSNATGVWFNGTGEPRIRGYNGVQLYVEGGQNLQLHADQVFLSDHVYLPSTTHLTPPEGVGDCYVMVKVSDGNLLVCSSTPPAPAQWAALQAKAEEAERSARDAWAAVEEMRGVVERALGTMPAASAPGCSIQPALTANGVNAVNHERGLNRDNRNPHRDGELTVPAGQALDDLVSAPSGRRDIRDLRSRAARDQGVLFDRTVSQRHLGYDGVGQHRGGGSGAETGELAEGGRGGK